MATISIKDPNSNNQASVNSSGQLAVEATVTAQNPGWSQFGQSTPKQVAVTNSTTLILNSNTNRMYASVMNNSNQTIYLQYSVPAIVGTGFRLMPGGVFIINNQELYQGQINAITKTGSVNIDVIEGTS